MVDWRKLVISEAAYKNNLGVTELFDFFAKADEDEEAEMDKILKNEDWDGFKKLIKKVIGVNLH